MPQTPTMSTCGSNGIGSMFSSTISTSQYGGHSAASVARPSGGFMVRLFGKTSASAHLELQKLSGNRGLISSRRMGTILLGLTVHGILPHRKRSQPEKSRLVDP